LTKLSEEGHRLMNDIANRYGVSAHAVEHLFSAVLAGQGSQAQFNHPDLGGMGQWSQGGMIMIGDMFNGNLKATVSNICNELSDLARNAALQVPAASHQTQYQGDTTSLFVPSSTGYGNWWPDDLGYAASTGAQNDLRYAFFPASRRLAISIQGRVAIYDTGSHQIGGFSQQQGGDQSLTFTSQYGLVRVSELTEVTPTSKGTTQEQPEASQPWQPPAFTPTAQPADTAEPAHHPSQDDIFTKIERLAALHAKGILRDEEFEAKKRELLDRL
jgi:hypothetical protein